MVTFALFEFGLGGDRIPPLVPGVLEGALTAAREPARSHAILGALAWPVLGCLLSVALVWRRGHVWQVA